jgi:hypothetical protein
VDSVQAPSAKAIANHIPDLSTQCGRGVLGSGGLCAPSQVRANGSYEPNGLEWLVEDGSSR